MPPGQPDARRLAGAQGADIASGLKLSTTGHPEARGNLFFQPRRWPTTCRPACRKARPTTRSSASSSPCANSTRRARWCWCPRTSTCASRPGRWPGDRRLPERQDARRPELLYSGALALPPDFWAKHGKTSKAGKAANTPSIDHRAHRPQFADRPVRLFRVARRAQV